MKYLILTFILAGLCGVPAQAQETFSHNGAGVAITIPAGWFYESDAEDFTIYTPGKELGISLAVMEAHEVDKAINEATAGLEKEFSDVQLGEVVESNANGMDSWELSGTANTRDGHPVIVYYCMVVTPAGKVLEISAVGTEAEFKKYASGIKQLDESLKPIK